ncbi:hypothetical protein HII17_02600 [Thalassotalea sp. M1531]|uniref:Uncharacterized protein n=1 Tax=Thalassotalea algicola TaxID=2716224 RepID=A0A7Y0Q5T2_9GAMM|nr:hypothetical protein [Thalassotalea algicola]NMP30441.1 hypothetical protein [Thalassotalea algicola]
MADKKLSSVALLLGVSLLTASFTLIAKAEQSAAMSEQHKQWLRNEFVPKHQAIIPKVAVADMFYGCNLDRKVDPIPYQLAQIIEKMDKGQLAEKLDLCLKGDTPQSDSALNYGLVGCFTDQLSALPKEERDEKMELVTGAIERLSREQRQKSFTKCVSEQAIKYIK